MMLRMCADEWLKLADAILEDSSRSQWSQSPTPRVEGPFIELRLLVMNGQFDEPLFLITQRPAQQVFHFGEDGVLECGTKLGESISCKTKNCCRDGSDAFDYNMLDFPLDAATEHERPDPRVVPKQLAHGLDDGVDVPERGRGTQVPIGKPGEVGGRRGHVFILDEGSGQTGLRLRPIVQSRGSMENSARLQGPSPPWRHQDSGPRPSPGRVPCRITSRRGSNLAS